MTVLVEAPRARVWRAIAEPAETLQWDEQRLAPLEGSGSPQPGDRQRWRYRLGSIPIVLTEQTLEVATGERLRSAVALGLFRFERTWTLADDVGDGPRTRVSLRLTASNSIPVLGGMVDRFAVRRMAAEYVDAKLRSLQKWCENHP